MWTRDAEDPRRFRTLLGALLAHVPFHPVHGHVGGCVEIHGGRPGSLVPILGFAATRRWVDTQGGCRGHGSTPTDTCQSGSREDAVPDVWARASAARAGASNERVRMTNGGCLTVGGKMRWRRRGVRVRVEPIRSTSVCQQRGTDWTVLDDESCPGKRKRLLL